MWLREKTLLENCLQAWNACLCLRWYFIDTNPQATVDHGGGAL